MKNKVKYQFSAKPWEYSGKGAWIFVILPQKMSQEIREVFFQNEEGWGRLKVTAKISETEWQTAIWFDSKQKTYLLPLKAEIRKKEKIELGKNVEVTILI